MTPLVLHLMLCLRHLCSEKYLFRDIYKGECHHWQANQLFACAYNAKPLIISTRQCTLNFNYSYVPTEVWYFCLKKGSLKCKGLLRFSYIQGCLIPWENMVSSPAVPTATTKVTRKLTW